MRHKRAKLAVVHLSKKSVVSKLHLILPYSKMIFVKLNLEKTQTFAENLDELPRVRRPVLVADSHPMTRVIDLHCSERNTASDVFGTRLSTICIRCALASGSNK